MAMHKVLLIGAGGFGKVHFNELIRLTDEGVLELAAVSDLRVPDEAAAVMAERGIRHYADYRDMLRSEKEADVVTVSTPIQFHAPMSIDAMEAGYHVLLEKPPGAAIQDVDRILGTERRTGKRCAVDFFAPSATARKRIEQTVASGAIGQVQHVRGLSLLKRTSAYFQRTPWAGKLKVGDTLVMDGAFHNPAAHLLYSMVNLAELLAETNGHGTEPSRVTAELYHANPIDSDDTSALRIEMSDGVELNFFVTLCARQHETQRIRIEGSNGAIEWDYNDQVTVWADGEVNVYDCAEGYFVPRRYRNLLRVIDGLDERLDVSLASARHFTLVANGAFESSAGVKTIPAPYVTRSASDDEPGAYVDGIEATMKEAFAAGKLFSELGVPWAQPSEPFALSGYGSFPQRFRLGG